MNTTPQRAKIDGSDVLASRHPFRVTVADVIIGQFSNLKLAAETARGLRGANVLDLTAKPPKVVYRDGRVLDEVK